MNGRICKKLKLLSRKEGSTATYKQLKRAYRKRLFSISYDIDMMAFKVVQPILKQSKRQRRISTKLISNVLNQVKIKKPHAK